MLKKIELATIILILIWISFFPAPIHLKYHLVVNISLVFAFAILLLWKRGRIFQRSDWPLWLFLLSIGFNVFFAQQRDIAFKTYLDLAVPMFCIYYLASNALKDEGNFNILAKTICICSILVALLGIFESLFAFNPIYEYFINNEYYPRYIAGFVQPMSTQFHPPVLGSFLLGCLPFNFLLFKQSKSFLKLLGASGIVLNIVVIILVFSRGVLLGLIAMIMFYLFVQKKYRSVAIFLTVIFILITLFSYLPYPFSRFGIGMMTTEGRGILTDYRFDRCIMTKNILKDYPFAGLGFQHFRNRFYDYYPQRNIFSYEFMIADNMYLTLLAETGLIGFLGFMTFIVYLFRRAVKKLAILTGKQQLQLQSLVVLCAFVGLIVNMGAYELFYWPNQYIFFCIITGCLAALCRKEQNNGKIELINEYL